MSIILQTLTAGNAAASGGTTPGTTGTVNPATPFCPDTCAEHGRS
ncbi:hypothetical protein [Paenibacillus rhizoplanae]